MHFYANNQFDHEIQTAIDQQLQWPNLSKPYVYAANKDLLNKFEDFTKGTMHQYAPQGRQIRIPFAIQDLLKNA